MQNKITVLLYLSIFVHSLLRLNQYVKPDTFQARTVNQMIDPVINYKIISITLSEKQNDNHAFRQGNEDHITTRDTKFEMLKE